MSDPTVSTVDARVTSGNAAGTPPGQDMPHGDETWLSNVGWLVVGRLLVAVLGWAGTIIVARNLDQETFGRFTFVFGLLGMMTIVTDLGLGRVALSGVMADNNDRASFAGTYVVLRSLLGLAGYALAVLFTVVARYPSEVVTATAVGGIVVIVATASHAYELILQAKLRMGVVAVSAVAGRLAQLGLIAIAVTADAGLLWVIVPAVIAEFIIAAIKIPWALRMQPMTYSVRPELWGDLIREAVPISVGAALATLYFRVDSIMLSKLADFNAVAVYGIAFKFVDLLHFVAMSISAPLLTVLVLAWPKRPERFVASVERTVGLFAMLAGVLIVNFGLFAAETVELLYGSRYVVAATSVQLLVIGEIIAFGSIVGLTVLTATAQHRPYPYIALVGLLLNVGLNVFAIDRWGYEGAAVTTIITEVVVVIGMWWLVRRVPEVGRFRLSAILIALPAIVAGLLVGAAVDSVGPWPIAATLATVTYAVGFLTVQRLVERRSGGSTPIHTSAADTGSPTVTIVGHSRSGSGAERVMLRYAAAMLDAGWPVRVVCPDGFLADELGRLGVAHQPIPDLQLPDGPRPVAAVTMAVRWLKAASIIARSSEQNEILIVNGLLALPAVRLAGRSRSAIWLVHDVVVRSDLRLVARLSIGPLAKAIGVSHAAAAFPRSVGVLTSVVRNGTAWPVEPAPLPLAPRPVVGINAMVTPWKGHHVLFDAVANLSGVDLEILGGRFPKDAPYLEQLQERASRPDLVGRVRFLGHQDDPLAAMRRWSVAVSASVEPEAGPLAVLEAMSLGIPVVATSHGGAVEVVGRSGLLVSPGDVDGMANALRRLTTDRVLRARCSAAGRVSVALHLTEKHSNEAFLAAVQHVAFEAAKPVKVLFINENIGGHKTVHLNLRAALEQRSDIEADFMDLPPATGLARLAGARVPGLAGLDLDLQPLRAQLIRSWSLARTLERRAAEADVIHLYTHNAGLLSAKTWRARPTVVSLDTTNAQNAFRLPGRRPTRFTPLTVAATKPFEQRVYDAATIVVANSAWAAASLRDDYAVDGNKMRLQPFGIAAPDFGDGAAPGPADGERPLAVFVGRSLERKGGLRLLGVHQRHFADRLDLTLVTEEAVPSGRGVTVINDLVPGDRRLWDLLRRSSMFVFPSEIDMAPNAVLEAMMAGLPIVARSVGAIPEMVVDGENGLLVDHGDGPLVEAIQTMLDNPDWARTMGAASRARALARYDAAKTTDALIDLLAEANALYTGDPPPSGRSVTSRADR